MSILTVKKKRVSKRNKKAWRKHTDIKDVDNFLDDQRLEERLGVKFSERADSDLFKIDTGSTTEKPKIVQLINEKRRRALEPPRCFQALQPTTAVPDPISKRNRVRTPEERKKGTIQKLIEDRNRQNGIVKKKERDSIRDRAFTKKIKKNIPKRGEFNKDLWGDEKEDFLGKASEWMTDDDVRHILTNVGKFKVRHPRTFMRDPKKYLSSLPTTENPHPGTSYNPSFTDHQELLKEVAEKEMKRIKEEEHLQRTTTNLFSKVSVDDRSASWLSEMSQGLHTDKSDDEENGGDYMSINPPTSFDKKKPLKKRRKLKEARMAELQRKKLLVEKKKISDIYKLKFLSRELDEKEEKYARVQEKRAKRRESMTSRTKRLNHNKFEEPDLVFKRGHEITGNLRTLEPEGNILSDRFYSMQRRNILPPSVKQNKTKRAKVKRYIKPGFRIEMEK